MKKEDILEEIVGDFTTTTAPTIEQEVVQQSDGSMIIEGSANLRDLNKMFGLLAKSNPTVLEWVRAHIIYFNQFPEWDKFKDRLLEEVDYKALYYHYLSLAKGGMNVMQVADNFTYKKVFYSIRGLMSAELATQQIMPELSITELFEQIDANDPLRHWAEDYLEIKKQQKEKAQVPEAEQIQILKLLNYKIEILSSRKGRPK